MIMLQETHTDISVESDWASEYTGKTYFSHGSSNSRGVAILLPQDSKVSICVRSVKNDLSGRILLLDCEIEGNPLLIVSIYAPTKDNVEHQISFLDNLKMLLEDYSDKPMVIGGDFNTYLNPKIDKQGGKAEKSSSYHSNLTTLIEEYSLADIWRLRNKDKLQFTWRSKAHTGLIQSRLDFFLVSLALESEIGNVAIAPSIGTDHSIITMSLNIPNTQKRGNSFWKFNNSLLKDIEYVNSVKKMIQEIIAENYFNDKTLLWEYTKCRIRSESMIYSSKKAKLKKSEEHNIIKNEIY